jgi:hypothetical protein
MPVVVFEISADSGFEFASAAMNPAAQLLLGEQSKPVELPRFSGRFEAWLLAHRLVSSKS